MDGLIEVQDKLGAPRKFVEKIFVFVIMWSIGALLELEDREKLQQFFEGLFKVLSKLFLSKHFFLHKFFFTETKGLDLDLPVIPEDSEDTIFDYTVEQSGEWVHWKTKTSGTNFLNK